MFVLNRNILEYRRYNLHLWKCGFDRWLTSFESLKMGEIRGGGVACLHFGNLLRKNSFQIFQNLNVIGRWKLILSWKRRICRFCEQCIVSAWSSLFAHFFWSFYWLKLAGFLTKKVKDISPSNFESSLLRLVLWWCAGQLKSRQLSPSNMRFPPPPKLRACVNVLWCAYIKNLTPSKLT